MIFERLDVNCINKNHIPRAKTPTQTSSLYFKASARRKFLQKHSERYKRMYEPVMPATYKSLHSIGSKVTTLDRTKHVLQEKNSEICQKSKKNRYNKAFTPTEIMLSSFNNGEKLKKLTRDLTPRKAYHSLLEKTTKEIRSEGLVGWEDF